MGLVRSPRRSCARHGARALAMALAFVVVVVVVDGSARLSSSAGQSESVVRWPRASPHAADPIDRRSSAHWLSAGISHAGRDGPAAPPQ